MGEQTLMPWAPPLLPEEREVPASATYPDWYKPARERRTGNRRVLLGLHPMGAELGAEGTTCGGCVHLWRKVLAKAYLKCDHPQIGCTGGPGTDVRKQWRGCAFWEAAPVPAEETTVT